MSENLKDILSNLNPDIDQETLLLYLQGKLTAEKQHEVEEKMLEDPFRSDALEGLENFSDKKKLAEIVSHLNSGLRKKTASKKMTRRPEIRPDNLVIITVLIVLLLIVISFFIIQRYLQQ